MKLLHSALAVALISACVAAASAPPKYPSPPPGKVMQDVVVYLSGEAMNSAWHVVTSRAPAGKFIGKPIYQWYVSVYEPEDAGFKLAYRAPSSQESWIPHVGAGSKGAPYLPFNSVKIVGSAELEQPAVQDAVLVMHGSGADCGESIVAVLGADRSFKVSSRVRVVNACDLQAKIVKDGSLQAVQLSGPYYANNAPMCCPTKAHATALLTGGKGKWRVQPNYFTISASLTSHL